jgi:DNA-binding transcriptional LysR family regulator
MVELRVRSVRATSNPHSGIDLPLRFGYSPFINHDLVSAALKGFCELVPEGKIEPTSECSGALMQSILQGDLEAALVSLPIPKDGLFVRKICSENVLVCMRADDPLAALEILPPESIEDRLRIIFARVHHPFFYDKLIKRLSKAGIRLNPSAFVSAPSEMQFLVENRKGLGLVRESTPLPEHLVTRRIAGLPIKITTAFVCREEQQRPVLPLLAYNLSQRCEEASRPCLFSGLLTLDCDSVLCSTWRVKSTSAARSEIDAQEKFISFFKVGVLTRVMSGRDSASLDTGAGAKAANNNVDDLSEVIRSLDKKAQGEFSLRLLLAARSAEQLRDIVPTVHRVFVDARAQVMEETLGNLSAFYAMFPGNHKFNVFPLWLAEDHHARLSSVFAPHIGHPHSEDLDSEYLNIFETRTRTPFFQDVYVDGVRVMLIIGPTGTGKSVHGNNLIALEQKYGGFTYIFDIGGSYESVVELYGGRVDRVGKDGPRVNPFALDPTESNIKFLYSFVKLLLTNGGAELEPEDDDVIHKAVQDIYLLDVANRRLSNLFLPKKLDRYVLVSYCGSTKLPYSVVLST